MKNKKILLSLLTIVLLTGCQEYATVEEFNLQVSNIEAIGDEILTLHGSAEKIPTIQEQIDEFKDDYLLEIKQISEEIELLKLDVENLKNKDLNLDPINEDISIIKSKINELESSQFLHDNQADDNSNISNQTSDDNDIIMALCTNTDSTRLDGYDPRIIYDCGDSYSINPPVDLLDAAKIFVNKNNGEEIGFCGGMPGKNENIDNDKEIDLCELVCDQKNLCAEINN